jgi:hypothetical protein
MGICDGDLPSAQDGYDHMNITGFMPSFRLCPVASLSA